MIFINKGEFKNANIANFIGISTLSISTLFSYLASGNSALAETQTIAQLIVTKNIMPIISTEKNNIEYIKPYLTKLEQILKVVTDIRIALPIIMFGIGGNFILQNDIPGGIQSIGAGILGVTLALQNEIITTFKNGKLSMQELFIFSRMILLIGSIQLAYESFHRGNIVHGSIIWGVLMGVALVFSTKMIKDLLPPDNSIKTNLKHALIKTPTNILKTINKKYSQTYHNIHAIKEKTVHMFYNSPHIKEIYYSFNKMVQRKI